MRSQEETIIFALIERAQFAPIQCRYKVYVIDEVHMLSNAAFNALLKTLEEPPDRVVFVLATTDPQRVLPTIISRCQRFDFRRIPLDAMVGHLGAIATQENIDITREAIQLVAQIAQGGLRDAESLLDQLSLSPDPVGVEKVWDLVGAVPERDLMVLLKAINRDDAEAVLDRTRQLMNRGRDPLIVLQNLAGFYRDLLIAKTAPDRHDLVAMTPPTWAELCDFAQTCDLSLILAGQQHLRACEVQIKNTTQPRLWLEVTLMGLLPSAMALQPTEDRGQRIKDRGQRPEARGQKTEDGKQRTEDKRQKTENGRQQQPPAISHQPPISSPQPQSYEQTTPTTHSPDPSAAPTVAASTAQQQSTPPNLQPPPQEQTAPPNPQPASENPQAKIQNPQALSQIWQQILQLLPPAPQALLKQHCNLLAFDGKAARISVRSQPLFKLAQSKLPNVETAFQSAFERKVRVTLEVAKPQETPAPTAPDNFPSQPSVPAGDATYEAAPPPVQRPPVVTPKPAPATPTPVTTKPSGSVPAIAEEPSQALPVPARDEGAASAAAARPTWELDEAAIAAQRLADFFNGEVVQLNDDLDLDDLPTPSQNSVNSPANTPPSTDPPNQNTPPPPTSNDGDIVPF